MFHNVPKTLPSDKTQDTIMRATTEARVMLMLRAKENMRFDMAELAGRSSISKHLADEEGGFRCGSTVGAIRFWVFLGDWW